MRKILTFIVSFFTLALFVVSLTQPMNASAAGDTEVSLDFTQEEKFLPFEGGKYSSTGEVKVSLEGNVDEVVIKYDDSQLVLKGYDKNVEVAGGNGTLKLYPKASEFVLTFGVALKSNNVYGVPFVGYVESINGEKVEELNSFYFVRGRYGDVNCDGVINLVDYSAIKQLLLGKVVKVNGEIADVKALADINHDGYVNYADYREMFDTISAANVNKEDVAVDNFGKDGYVTVLVKEEGLEDRYESVKVGETINGQVVINNNQEIVIENDPENEYIVHYFFSTAAGSTPVVEYVEAGDPIRLIIENGELLYPGYITWYRFIQDPKGHGKFVEIHSGDLMPEEDIYLYAFFKDQYTPKLIYKLQGENWVTKEYDFFTVIKEDEINSVNNRDENNNGVADLEDVEGYMFIGWFEDAECTKPAKEITIMGLTHLYAKMSKRTYTLSYYIDDEAVESVLDKYYLYEADLSEADLNAYEFGYTAGMMFKGWVEKGQSEKFDFTTMPARNVALYADWYDVVKDVADKLNKKAQEVGINDLIYASYDETVKAVKEVILTLDVDKAVDFNGGVNTEALEGILGEALKYAAENYTEEVVSKLEVNGYVVYDNGTIYNSQVRAAVISILNGILTEVANDAIDDVVVEINDSRTVNVKAELKGSEENLAKVREYAGKLADHIEVYFDNASNETIVEVLLPSSLVAKVEQAANGAHGEELISYVNLISVEELLIRLKDATNGLNPATLAVLDAVVKNVFVLSDYAEHIDYQKDIQVYIDGVKVVLSSEATTLAEFIDELLAADSQIAALLDKTMLEYYVDYGYHEFPIEVKFNLEEVPQLEYTSFTEIIKLRLYFYAKAYSINFDPQGGKLVIPNDQEDLVVNGYNVSGKVTTTVNYEITREGYEFAGWCEHPNCNDANCYGIYNVEIKYGNKNYYAKWDAIEYAINYDFDKENAEFDGTAPVTANPNPSEYNIESGVSGILSLNDPTRKHYKFNGWLISYTGEEDDYKPFDGNIDVVKEALAKHEIYLKADWQSESYKIAYADFDPDGYLYITDLRDEDENLTADSIEYYDAVNLLEQFRNHGFNIVKPGYTIVAWEWKLMDVAGDAWKYVDAKESLNVQGNIIVKPLYEANKYVVTFDVNTPKATEAAVNPSSKVVSYDEAYGELPTPVAPGYKFVGWYTSRNAGELVTEETIYQIDGDSKLYARWELIDVVQNAVDNAEEFLNAAIEEKVAGLPFEFTTTTALNSKEVELVNNVTLTIIAEKLLDVNNYQLVEEEFLNLFGKIAESTKEDKELVDTVTYNGQVLFSNGKIDNIVFRSLVLDLLNGSVEEIGKGNVPTLEVVINEVLGTRTVKFEVVLDGSDELKAKVKNFAARLATYISASYDADSVDIQINLPPSVIKALEDEINKMIQEDPNMKDLTLAGALEFISFGTVLDGLANNADLIAGSHKEVVDAVSKLVARLRTLINQVASEDLLTVTTISSMNVFKDGATFDPADESFGSVLKALKDVLSDRLLDESLASFGENLVYTIPLDVTADATALGMFSNDLIEDRINITIVFDANEYVINLDTGDGKFADDTTELEITGTVGEMIEVKVKEAKNANPTQPLYKFVGWYDENGNKVEKFENKNMNLVAKYEEIEYTINFVSKGELVEDSLLTDISNELAGDFTVNLEGIEKANAYEYKYTTTQNDLDVYATSNKGYYVFAGWMINGTYVSAKDNVNVFSGKAFADYMSVDFKESVTEVTVEALWERNEFSVFYYHEGGAGRVDLFAYDTWLDVEDNMYWIKVIKDGYYIVEWKWAFLNEMDPGYVYDEDSNTIEFTDEFKDVKVFEDKGWTTVAKDGAFQVKGDVVAVPVLKGNIIKVNLDNNTTDDASVKEYDNEVYVRYDGLFNEVALEKDGEFNNELPEPVRSGYVFAGWFLDKDCQVAVPEKVGAEYKDAKSINLFAKWVDVVEDAYNKGKDAIDAVEGDLLTSKPVYGDTDVDGKEIITEINVNVDVESILNGTATLDQNAADGLIEKAVEYINETYTTLVGVSLNGADVLVNGIIINEGIAEFNNAYIESLLENKATKEDVLPEIKVVLTFDNGATREVVINFGSDKVTDETLNKINVAKEELGKLFVIENNEYTIMVPQAVVEKLEKEAYKLGDGNSIESMLESMTIAELFDHIVTVDKNDVFENEETLEVLEKLVKFGYKYEGITNALFNSEVIKSDLLVDDAYYAPADDSLAAAIAEIKELLSIKDKTLGELHNDTESKDGKIVYTVKGKTTYDASSLGEANAPYVEENTKLNIIFVKNVYTVELYDAYGQLFKVIKGYVNDYAPENSAELRKELDSLHIGYYFNGWYTDLSLTTEYDNSGDFVFRMPAENIKLYAQYLAGDFSVIFNANGGVMKDYGKEVVEIKNFATYDKKYGTLPTATREHYEFAGWYLNGKLVTEDTIVKTDSTHELVAEWKATEYDATVYAAEFATDLDKAGDLRMGNKEMFTFKFTTLTELKDFLANYETLKYAVEGYDFIGWSEFTDADLEAAVAAGKAEIVAIYKPHVYTAEYVIDNKVVETLPFTVEDADGVVDGEPNINEKYHVTGMTGEWSNYVIGAADLTIVGTYVGDEYNLLFTTAYEYKGVKYTGYFDGVNKTVVPVTVNYGDSVYFEDIYTSVYCSGYEFIEWFYVAKDANGNDVEVVIEDGDVINIAKHSYIESLGYGATVEVYARFAAAIYEVRIAVNGTFFCIKSKKFTYAGATLDLETKYTFPSRAHSIQVYEYNEYGQKVLVDGFTAGNPMSIAEARAKGLLILTINSDIDIELYDEDGKLL